MRPLGMRITFEVVLGAVLLASLVTILRQSRRIAEYQRQQAADAQSLRLFRDALRQKDLQKPQPETMEQTLEEQEHAAISKREAVIAQLDRELAQTRAANTELQAQLSTSNEQNAKARTSAEEQLQKQQADAQAQIEDLQKKLDAALAESQIARLRASALEAENAKLTAGSATGTARTAEIAHIVASLRDLDRRRDVYLTSILRRYSDITGEFNAMGSMLDTSHDAGSGACNSAALIRIQNAVSSAQDDLRQLGELNARAEKLEKQLRQK